MSLRGLAEKSLRGITLKRRLPAYFGGVPIWVSPEAGLRYMFRRMHDIDPSLLSNAREYVKPGHTIWDVGANVGLFAFAAAHCGGRTGCVLAFEPDVWLVQLLRRSARIQPEESARVEVIPAAVAGSVELRKFMIAARSRAANFLQGFGSSQTGGIREEQTVLAVNLDWISTRYPGPDIIKIDVEGAELEVLRGARETIAAKRPIIICEVNERQCIEVSAFLRDHGYLIYDGDEPIGVRRPLQHAPWNTVAVPY